MKANLLKKITSSALITMNIEEKRNLDLKNIDEKIEIEPFKKNYFERFSNNEHRRKKKFRFKKHNRRGKNRAF